MQALNVANVTKTYSANDLKALNSVSLTVEAGDFFGLLGPNGAGKTTLISIITSLTRKNSGTVHINGIDIDHHLNRAKSYIGLVPQEFNFNIFLSVWDTVINQAGYYGIPRSIAKKRAKKYLSDLGLWHRRKQLVRFLSGGLKRRLMIARALVHNPSILFLDEPTAGVDIELRRWLWDFLKEQNRQGLTIILTTHYLEEAEQLCKDIAIIDKGEIVKRTKVKNLLRELQTQAFIFDLRHPITATLELNGFPSTLLDPLTLEVNVPHTKNLNQLFDLFNEKGIIINSMRNKSNRLEELFLKLTKGHADAL
jgi:ABC-2 type transport system ATP-binding protein